MVLGCFFWDFNAVLGANEKRGRNPPLCDPCLDLEH